MRFFVSCLFLLLVFSPAAYGQEGQGQLENPQEKKINIEDIPEQFFLEADGYAKHCSDTRELRAYYNCDCLGNAYLMKRIDRPDADPGQIQLDITTTCLDATEAAGLEYEQCLGDAPVLPLDQTPEAYCTCFANTYAKLFQSAHMAVGSKLITELKTQAYITCSDPTQAARMNPQKPVDTPLTP